MKRPLIVTLGIALGLAACASAPQPNAALESAKAAIQTAETDPNVAKYAALDLAAAQKELSNAQAAEIRHDVAVVNQQSYLAGQTARLAQARAATKADEAAVASSQSTREQIQLQARAREAEEAQARAAAATAQTQALQAEIDKLKATETNRGLVLTLGDVLFDTGKAQLNPGAARKLDDLAQFLQQNPQRRVEIDGFTDSTGSSAFNQELSQDRAAAVKAALIARGIDPSRITTEGYGSAFPVASNNDAAGRQQNRRVEVVIGGPNGSSIAPRG